MATKKIITLITSVCLTILLGCYEDKTNTDFQPVETIVITGINSDYRVEQSVGVVSITPTVESNYEAEWEYCWIYYEGTDTTRHLISTEKDLNQVFKLAAKTYDLVFSAKNLKTGLTQYATTRLMIETPFTKGWYVLKDDGQNTDMDLFGIEEESPSYFADTSVAKLKNVLSSENGTGMKGKAVKFCFATDLTEWDETGMPVDHRVAIVISEEEYKVYNTENMKVMQDRESAFIEPLASMSPNAVYAMQFNFWLINDGRLWASGSNTGSGLYSNYSQLGNDEDYNLSKFMALSSSAGLFFDEYTGSFVTSSMYGDGLAYLTPDSESDINPTNTGLTCLYMGNCIDGKAVGVFADKLTGERKILRLSNTYLRNGVQIKINEVLDENDRLNAAEMITASATDEVLFFVDAQGDIWSHFLNDAGNEYLEFDVPSDESVTFIRPIRETYSGTIDHIVVATVKGAGSDAEYTIRFFKKLGGRFDEEDEYRRLTGEGYARDVLMIIPDITNNRYFANGFIYL